MTERASEGLTELSRRRVRPWTVGLPATIVAVLMGLLYANETLLAAAAIPLAYLVYETVSEVSRPPSLAAERSIDATAPAPGETVSVTLAVTNTGDRTLTDLRVIDGVPDTLTVTRGTPRIARPLRPGETVETTYAVVAKRGTVEFDRPMVKVRPLAESTTLAGRLSVAGDQQLIATAAVRESPTDPTPLPRAGQHVTDEGGPGREFHATRPYQPGDPIRRIDWRRLAKTGELVTVQYRRERASTTVVLVDGSPRGSVAPVPGHPTGTTLAGYAAERLQDVLRDAGVTTVVGAVRAGWLPTELLGPDGLAWVDTDGRRGRAATKQLFGALQRGRRGQRGSETDGAGGQHGVLAADPPGTGEEPDAPGTDVRRVLDRLPADAQVIVCTPLVDDWPVELVGEVRARGYPAVVVSPDVTTGQTPGQRLAAVHRQLRLAAIDRTGATAIDWTSDTRIDRTIRAAAPEGLIR